jgi:hypothetical protein
VSGVRQVEAPARRSVVSILIAVVVAATGVLHGIQGIRGMHGGGDPPLLLLEHLDVCLFSLVAAFAIWRGKRWSPWALAVAGAATAALVVSLGPLLKLDPVARGGLWTGAATIAVLTALGVWYLERRVQRLSS